MLKSDWICNGWINSDSYIDDVEIAAFRLFSALINWELFANKTTFSIWKILIPTKQNILPFNLTKMPEEILSLQIIVDIFCGRNDFLCDPVI